MTLRTLPSRLLPIGALIACGGRAWRAAATRTFHQSTSKDFEEGEATGSMVQPTGEVVPGMKATAVEAPGAFTWCSALSRDGSVAYFGGGDDGKIYAVETKPGKTPEKARLVATLDAPWVTALAVRADGSLLAGTTPGGRLFAVDPRSGAAKEFARVPAEHLWANVYDDRSATAYVGTGAPGKVFVVDAKGKSRALWDSARQGDRRPCLARDDANSPARGHLRGGDPLSRQPRTGAARPCRTSRGRGGARRSRAWARRRHDRRQRLRQELDAARLRPPAAKGTTVVISAGGPPSSAGSLQRPGARKAGRQCFYRLESATDASSRSSPSLTATSPRSSSATSDARATSTSATGTQGRVSPGPPRSHGGPGDRSARAAGAHARSGAIRIGGRFPRRHRRRRRRLPRAARGRRRRVDIPLEGLRRRDPLALGPLAPRAARKGSPSRRAAESPRSPTRAGRPSRSSRRRAAASTAARARWRARRRATSSTA